MDIKDLRLANLRAILETEFGGNAAELSRQLGRSASQINDLFGGRKSFGEKFARTIEPLLGKPALWLDSEHPSAPSAHDDYKLPTIATAHGLFEAGDPNHSFAARSDLIVAATRLDQSNTVSPEVKLAVTKMLKSILNS